MSNCAANSDAGKEKTVTSLTVVQGIDVSQWQGSFPWQQWQGRIGFAMAKATEGDAETDPQFGANWAGMWELDRRMPRFAYGFFHASLDPVIQAAHLVATVRGQGLLAGDNFALDLESTDPDTQLNDGLPPGAVAPLAVECLREINRLAPGHRVLPYMNPAWALEGGGDGMAAWYLWLADYGVPAPTAPAPWDRATFWQYTDQPVDGDRFLGDEAQLLAFTRMPDKR
jgi:Glycosyl hydrolases family 25